MRPITLLVATSAIVMSLPELLVMYSFCRGPPAWAQGQSRMNVRNTKRWRRHTVVSPCNKDPASLQRTPRFADCKSLVISAAEGSATLGGDVTHDGGVF